MVAWWHGTGNAPSDGLNSQCWKEAACAAVVRCDNGLEWIGSKLLGPVPEVGPLADKEYCVFYSDTA